MATVENILKTGKAKGWEIEEVSEDSFQRITFDALTYEVCLDGSNVFYMEFTKLCPAEEILDGNLFKFEKDGTVVHVWSLDNLDTEEIMEMIVTFDKER